MFDARLRPIIDPLLDRLGRGLARLGVTANQATLLAALCGAAAGIAIAFSHFNWGLALIVASRVLDGLDGAIARATRPTDFGGFLDIVGDYVFYIAVPVGFGLASPDNAVGAISLLAAFTLTGISFMALATLAAKRGLDISTDRKSTRLNSSHPRLSRMPSSA